MEAALAQKACIGGRSGGIADAVIDGVTGKLVDPHDPEDVAMAVLSLLADEQTARLMGANGYKRAKTNFNWHTNVSAWEQELNQLHFS